MSIDAIRKEELKEKLHETGRQNMSATKSNLFEEGYETEAQDPAPPRPPTPNPEGDNKKPATKTEQLRRRTNQFTGQTSDGTASDGTIAKPAPTMRRIDEGSLSNPELTAGAKFSLEVKFGNEKHNYDYDANNRLMWADTGNNLYRKLDTDALKKMSVADKPAGWFLMDGKDPNKIKNAVRDVTFRTDANGNRPTLIVRDSTDVAHARLADGWHEGQVNAMGAFIEKNQYGHTTRLLFADLSEATGEYPPINPPPTDLSKPIPKPELSKFTVTDFKGEQLTFARLDKPSLTQTRYRATDKDGKTIDVYNPDLDHRGKMGLLTFEDQAGTTTMVFGNGASERWGTAGLPLFRIDTEGRPIQIANGDIRRDYKYADDTANPSYIREEALSGTYKGKVCENWRLQKNPLEPNAPEKWTVQNFAMVHPVQKNAQNQPLYNPQTGAWLLSKETVPGTAQEDHIGPIGFLQPGSVALGWYEGVNPQTGGPQMVDAAGNCLVLDGKGPGQVLHLVNPNGSEERVRSQINKNPEGKTIGFTDKYYTVGNNPQLTAIQKRDANRNPITKKITKGDPNDSFDLEGDTLTSKRNGITHITRTDGQEAIMDDTTKTYRQKVDGIPTRMGPRDAAGNMDEDNCWEITLEDKSQIKEDGSYEGKITLTRYIQGEALPPATVTGLMKPTGEVWHEVEIEGQKETAMAVELPNLTTMYMAYDETKQDYVPKSVSISDGKSFASERKFGPSLDPNRQQSQDIADTFVVPNNKYIRRLTAITTDQAYDNGLPIRPELQYAVTLKIVPTGKEEKDVAYAIPPPSEVQAGSNQRPLILSAVRILDDGTIEGTDPLSRQRVRLPIAQSVEQIQTAGSIVAPYTRYLSAKNDFTNLVNEQRSRLAAAPAVPRPSGRSSVWTNSGLTTTSRPNLTGTQNAEAAKLLANHELPPIMDPGTALPDQGYAALANQYEMATAIIKEDLRTSKLGKIRVQEAGQAAKQKYDAAVAAQAAEAAKQQQKPATGTAQPPQPGPPSSSQSNGGDVFGLGLLRNNFSSLVNPTPENKDPKKK